MRDENAPTKSNSLADAFAESSLRLALDTTSIWELYDIDKSVQIDLPVDTVDITDRLDKPGL